MKANSPSSGRPRTGVAIIAVIVLVLVVGLVVLGMVGGGARDQALTARRIETVQSFYAAEGVMNMSIREMMIGVDEDGDGAIGTISDDTNDATDPDIGVAKALGTKTAVGFVNTMGSQGRGGLGRRKIEAVLD